MKEFKHIPVLLEEVISGLDIKPGGIYIDCTMGGGGHSSEILKRLDKQGRLIGFDKDDDAVATCQEKFKAFDNVEVIKSDFKNAPTILKDKGLDGKIDGILIDLGVSSYQIDSAERGFSFLHNGRLDMRMDQTQELTAYDVVNFYSERELLRILYDYGEENNAKNIVRNIIKAREKKPIETTFELKEIVESSFPKKVIYGKGGVSKQTFQAIRIEVNGELKGLEECLDGLAKILNHGGRMAVISFHSLEDRIVKNVFKLASTDCICPPKTPVCICGHKAIAKLITRKPITATQKELEQNSRSASAKLRVIEKL